MLTWMLGGGRASLGGLDSDKTAEPEKVSSLGKGTEGLWESLEGAKGRGK